MLTGTATLSGNMNSEAVRLARSYSSRFYPEWYSRNPGISRGTSYLTGFNQMRWYITGTSIISDPDDYRNMSAAEILEDLFGA